MRLRHIAKAEPFILESEFVEHDPAGCKGRWKERFGNDHPLHIEIGTGKGQFIMALAEQNPDINYIGIEKADSVLYKALLKQHEKRLPNLLMLWVYADALPDIFDENEVERIYLNFSDPWPKDRHADRRLTSHKYLDLYRKFLKQTHTENETAALPLTGRIEFKTDNAALFDYSLESAASAGWTVKEITRDLHHSEYAAGNIMTEYEQRFSAEGNPICRAVFEP